MQDTFSLALEARTAWANFRVAVVASEGAATAAARTLAATAKATARELGVVSCPDTMMPNLIADVPELIQQWSDGYAEGALARSHHSAFLSRWAQEQREREAAGHDGGPQAPDFETFRRYHARISEMANEAHRCCGLSYEYVVSLLCAKVEPMLAGLPPAERPAVAFLAREFGYVSPDELAAGQEEMAEEGYCRHGLDYWTCPCGCFEN